jgi:TRAP-type C4-dicarboxylate transport system permease small subunit
MDMKKERSFEQEPPEQSKVTPLTWPDKALAFIMGLIAGETFLQIFFRYVLNNSLTWTEEITRFLFIWLVFLGTAINIRDRWNIGVDVLASVLPKSYRRHLPLLDMLLVLGFLIFLVLTGFVWVYLSRGSYSSAVGLPFNIVLYGALPLTSVLGCYYCLINLKKLRKTEREEHA